MADVELYRSEDGIISLDVKTDGQEVWLTQAQMAELFGREIPTIIEHIANAQSEELADEATTRYFRVVRSEGSRQVERQIQHYSLDMILSVGYRVKSHEGIAFRRWANDVLKRYTFTGIARNEIRIRQIEEIASLLARSEDETVAGIATVIERYLGAHNLLDAYDHGTLPVPTGNPPVVPLGYDTARAVVNELRTHFPDDALFGKERGDAFAGILGQIEQTYAGEDVYRTTQEKAANLLYFVVKDHPFADGNKRSAAALFTHYLATNGGLEDAAGRELVSSNALVALTLMTAMSRPDEKETIVRMLMNMLS